MADMNRKARYNSSELWPQLNALVEKVNAYVNDYHAPAMKKLRLFKQDMIESIEKGNCEFIRNCIELNIHHSTYPEVFLCHSQRIQNLCVNLVIFQINEIHLLSDLLKRCL